MSSNSLYVFCFNNSIESEKINKEASTTEEVEKNRGDDEVNTTKGSGVCSSTPAIPCIDRLREELSCAVRRDNRPDY